MNRILLIILFFSVLLLNTFKVQAQTSIYHEFPDSNAVWTVLAHGCCFGACPPPTITNPVVIDFHFSYSIVGDTLINNTAYKKLQHSGGTTHEHCAVGGTLNIYNTLSPTLAGSFREDIAQKKVYFIEANTTMECVLYDFNLTAGDTLHDGCQNWAGPAVVDVVDSVMIGNTYRKRFSFLNATFGPYYIIEGIGSTSGLLEPIFPFEYIGNLICFSQDGQTLYPDTNSSCQIITTSIPPPPTAAEFSVAPNPFSSTTTITADSEYENCELEIYNILGAKEKSVIIHKGKNEIDRSNLSNGIYFYRITGSRNSVAFGKFVVQ